MLDYTMLTTWHKYGSKAIQLKASQVRSACENERKMRSINKWRNLKEKDVYIRIEVINNNTGEIREYWNNHDNKIKF